MYKDIFSIGCKQWYSKACSVKVKGSERVLRWFHFPFWEITTTQTAARGRDGGCGCGKQQPKSSATRRDSYADFLVAGLHHLTSQSNRGDFPHMYLFSHRTIKKIALTRNTA